VDHVLQRGGAQERVVGFGAGVAGGDVADVLVHRLGPLPRAGGGHEAQVVEALPVGAALLDLGRGWRWKGWGWGEGEGG